MTMTIVISQAFLLEKTRRVRQFQSQSFNHGLEEKKFVRLGKTNILARLGGSKWPFLHRHRGSAFAPLGESKAEDVFNLIHYPKVTDFQVPLSTTPKPCFSTIPPLR